MVTPARDERTTQQGVSGMPGIEVRSVADAHHRTALAQPDRVSEIPLRFLAGHAN